MFKTVPKTRVGEQPFEDEDRPFKIALGLFALSALATSAGVLLATVLAS